ncbi:molybdopterin-binding protein [Methyloferula stellata]|uniref:molybdopterin-binding protein n=1 Tax=Methyloferula stellata TaxID=876270 RepID=UPI0003656F96|nr:molybdopterin-binding protein [Methyloferula stellata]
MKFGPVPVEKSLGGIVAHGVRYKGLVLKKGEIIELDHIGALKAVGFDKIVVAELEQGDIEENAAALALAKAVAGDNLTLEAPATGRVNIYAMQDGVFGLDEAFANRVNDVDERITLATLPPMQPVVAGDMVATVKIIPFSVPEDALACAIDAAQGAKLAVSAYRPLRIGVVSTLLPGLKASVVEKTLNVLAERIAMTPAKIVGSERVMHDVPALAQAIAAIAPLSDIIIIFGASAITDRRDVIPAAIEQSGGRIVHFGMPVDPGNLLLLGQLQDGTCVIGAPGCARSPKESGFDWVLQRMLAGLNVTSADIKRMGAGGLLIENAGRARQPASHLLEAG